MININIPLSEKTPKALFESVVNSNYIYNEVGKKFKILLDSQNIIKFIDENDNFAFSLHLIDATGKVIGIKNLKVILNGTTLNMDADEEPKQIVLRNITDGTLSYKFFDSNSKVLLYHEDGHLSLEGDDKQSAPAPTPTPTPTPAPKPSSGEACKPCDDAIKIDSSIYEFNGKIYDIEEMINRINNDCEILIKEKNKLDDAICKLSCLINKRQYIDIQIKALEDKYHFQINNHMM